MPLSPDASLESLGITSGDLIYFSTNRSAFWPNPNIGEPVAVAVAVDPVSESHRMPESCSNGEETSNSGDQIQESASIESSNLEGTADLGIISPNQEIAVPGLPQVQDLGLNQTLISQGSHTQGKNCSNQPESQSPTLEETEEAMEIDTDSAVQKFSEPYFLRRVLREELEDDRIDHKLMVIAFHAVLLESGFIGFDSISRMPVNRFHLSDKRSFAVFTVRYTLPELLKKSNPESDFTDHVVIKFQNLGNFINVYGCLSKGGSPYRICLDERRFAPILDCVWANCDENGRMEMDEDVSLKSYQEKEVFEFWRTVKDGLALPLLFDLCESSGLALPACLMRLPTELKLKIFESLSGKDLARVECVCSELRYLASNNDLWKQKTTEEFGDGSSSGQGMVNWREKFVSNWEKRQQQKLAITLWPGYPRIQRPQPQLLPRIWRDPDPFGGGLGPGIIGGDYDLLPGPIRSPLRFPRARPGFMRNFSPNCNLGGRHDDA